MADEPVADDAVEFKRWREVWRVHQDADRMPMATPDEQQQLALDIEHSGMLNPIEFLIADDFEPEEDAADQRIALLDGRNRLDCLDRLGYRFAHPPGRGPLWRTPDGEIEELFCRYVTENDTPFPFERVISLNLARRHLTTAQKRGVIEALLLDLHGLSNRELARKVAVDDKTVAAVRQRLEELGKLVPQEATVGRDGRTRTTKPRRAAKPKEAGPPTVTVEKERLVRLSATRYARDSGDLFSWTKDGPQKIAHTLVQDGCAQSSLDKVQEVFQLGLNETKRLAKEARDEQRAARATPGRVANKKLGDIAEEERAAIRSERQAGQSFVEIAAAHGIFQDLVRKICSMEAKPSEAAPAPTAEAAPAPEAPGTALIPVQPDRLDEHGRLPLPITRPH